MWATGAFVLATAYCGLLKGNMMSPPLTKPINTLSDLLESDLPPVMVGYDEYEAPMLYDEDPIVKSVHERRKEIEFEMVPKVKENFINYDYKLCLK